MSFQELMIREEHLTGLGVLGMADTPGLSTAEMQKKLEELSRELIIPRVNLVLEELTRQQETTNTALEERPTDAEVKQTVTNEMDAAIKAYLDTKLDSYVGSGSAAMLNAHPVGSIYLSVSSTSPATLFGGTWERIQNCFLLAAGSSYAAGTTGGEAEHTLTVDELPAHSHRYQTSYGTAAATETTNGKFQAGAANNGWNYDQSGSIYKSGSDAAHNNMPPYLAVYVWKRTA